MPEESSVSHNGWRKTRILALGLGQTKENITILSFLFLFHFISAFFLSTGMGLSSWSPTVFPLSISLVIGLKYFLYPACCEELIFRWILFPLGPKEASAFDQIPKMFLISTAYVLSKVICGLIFPEQLAVLLHPAALLVAFSQSFTCCAMYVVSRSIWPPIFVNWVTLFTWRFLFMGVELYY